MLLKDDYVIYEIHFKGEVLGLDKKKIYLYGSCLAIGVH